MQRWYSEDVVVLEWWYITQMALTSTRDDRSRGGNIEWCCLSDSFIRIVQRDYIDLMVITDVL